VDLSALVNDWKSRLQPTTVHNYRGNLMRLLKFVDEVTGTSLARSLPKVPPGQNRTRVCSDEDFSNLLLHATPWFRAFLMLCRYLGLRNSEAARVSPECYDPATNVLTFRRKSEGTSSLPVPGELSRLFVWAEKISRTQPLIQTVADRSATARPIHKQTIYNHWMRACKAAGVKGNLIIHDLRRTIASRAYEQTKDLRVVQQILGHRRLTSSLTYITGLPSDDIGKAITNALPREIHDLPLATEVKQ